MVHKEGREEVQRLHRGHNYPFTFLSLETGSCYAGQAILELSSSPPEGLELQACATKPGFQAIQQMFV